jgi:hypothetical protein
LIAGNIKFSFRIANEIKFLRRTAAYTKLDKKEKHGGSSGIVN